MGSQREYYDRRLGVCGGFKLMKIEVVDSDVVYITINGRVVYIDDSTNELIIDTWDDEGLFPAVDFKLDDEFKKLIDSHKEKPTLKLVPKEDEEDE